MSSSAITPMGDASLKRGALTLTAAAALDFALQLLLPVALVRLLPAGAFADYRLAWLAIGAAMAVAPLALPRSLFYLLPRSAPAQQGAYVHNTVLLLLAAGAGAGLLLGPWNALLPASLRQIAGGSWFLPVFLPLWVAASLADCLPSARGEPGRQAALSAALACLRVAAIALAALSGQVQTVFGALLAYAAFKLALLAVYASRRYRAPPLAPRLRALRPQLAYALPFGAASALFLLRGQADQWVAASLFPAAAFAAFSIGAVIMPLVALLRASVGNAIGARLSQLAAQRRHDAMLALNQRANLALAFALLPALALTALLAEHIVALVYTPAFLAAAAVLRVNCLALLGVAVEVSTLTMVLGQGRFLLAADAVLLPAGVAAAVLGACWWGLPGAALGNCVTLAAGNAFSFWRVARVTGVPLRRLQPWGALLRILGAAAGAAPLALLFARAGLVAAPLAEALLAGAVYGLAYVLLLGMLGMLPQARALFWPAVLRPAGE
jgi:O-antigen/teichoic acid export membrane protein